MKMTRGSEKEQNKRWWTKEGDEKRGRDDKSIEKKNLIQRVHVVRQVSFNKISVSVMCTYACCATCMYQVKCVFEKTWKSLIQVVFKVPSSQNSLISYSFFFQYKNSFIMKHLTKRRIKCRKQTCQKRLLLLIKHIILAFKKVQYHLPKKGLSRLSQPTSEEKQNLRKEKNFPHILSRSSLTVKSLSPLK